MAGMIEPRCLIISIYRVLRRARDEPDHSSPAVIGRGVHAPKSRELHWLAPGQAELKVRAEVVSDGAGMSPADHMRLTDRIAIVC